MTTCNSIGLRTLALVAFIFALLGFDVYHNKVAYESGPTSVIFPPEDGLAQGELGMALFPTGSRLPDCTHACGACTPCKRVMVSFKCSVAESCPIVYRCMCKGKYYHVPSN